MLSLQKKTRSNNWIGVGKEDSELITFFDYIRIKERSDPRYSAIFHVENERRCAPWQGARRKRKGVKAGVVDVLCMVPVNGTPGLFAELKIKPNRLSESQLDFMKLMHCMGYRTRVAWSSDELIEIVDSYLKGE